MRRMATAALAEGIALHLILQPQLHLLPPFRILSASTCALALTLIKKSVYHLALFLLQPAMQCSDLHSGVGLLILLCD